MNPMILYIVLSGLFAIISYYSIDLNEVNIELHSAETLSDLSQVASVNYIYLQDSPNNPGSFIQYANKVEISNEHIVILQGRKAPNAIFIFDREGNFKNKINGEDDGPFRFPFGSDIQVEENSIFILDRTRSKLIKYLINENKFENESISPVGHQFEYLNKNFIFYNNQNLESLDFNSIIIKSDNDKINTLTVKNSDYFQNFEGNQFFLNKSNSKNDNYVVHYRPFDNKIYLINERGCNKIISINLKEWVKDEQITNLKNTGNYNERFFMLVDHFNENSYISRYHFVSYINDKLFLVFKYKDKYFWLFIHPDSLQYKLLKFDDHPRYFLDNFSPKKPFPLTTYKNQIVFLLSPEFIENYKNELSDKHVKSYTSSIAEYINKKEGDSNPLLMFLTIN